MVNAQATIYILKKAASYEIFHGLAMVQCVVYYDSVFQHILKVAKTI